MVDEGVVFLYVSDALCVLIFYFVIFHISLASKNWSTTQNVDAILGAMPAGLNIIDPRPWSGFHFADFLVY